MKRSFILICFVLVSSCIPYSFAPNIKGTKLTKAKRFKRDLPNLNALIFKDPGEEGDFKEFMNKKFGRNPYKDFTNVPLHIDGKTYYISYYERERSTRTLDLFPIFFDGVMDASDVNVSWDGEYTSRYETWYVILTATNEAGDDCLAESYKERLPVANHLRLLYYEYHNPMNAAGILPEAN